jgi:hypothetical protein
MTRSLVLCFLTLSAPDVVGASEQYVLKSQGIYCPVKYISSAEEIADATTDRALKQAVGAAVSSGKCANSGNDVPMLVDKASRKRTPRGSLYYCYARRGEQERACSDARSMTTLAALRAERTGDYGVMTDNDNLLVVKCAEGGHVFVEKGAQWRRTSTVIFDGQEPVGRIVPANKEHAARDGCKGF